MILRVLGQKFRCRIEISANLSSVNLYYFLPFF